MKSRLATRSLMHPTYLGVAVRGRGGCPGHVYLAGLVGVSNAAGRGETLVAVLEFAQKWTATIDWSTFEAADATLRALDAYTDPGVAETLGLRLRLPA